jgi:protoporphyrinogen/coproporphyrinogen III oxidase
MRVGVIGAGLAGSAAAYRLRRAGHEVVLADRKGRVGGRAWTHRQAGFSIDVGADVILSFYNRSLSLLRELGREDHLIRLDSSNATRNGRRLHAMKPASPIGVVTHPHLMPWDMARLGYAAGRARLGRPIDLFDLEALALADEGETIAEWARRTVGERGYQHIIRPGIETRWYYSCEEAAAPLAKALTRLAPGTRFYCLDPGMGELARWLTAGIDAALETEVTALEAVGEEVFATTAEGVRHSFDAVVLATDAGRAAKILPPGPSADALAGIRFAHNVRVVIGYRRNPWPNPLAKAFFATGPGQHQVAGVTLVSGKSPTRVPTGAEAAEVHFSGWASERLDDAEAIAAAKVAVADHLGRPGEEPLFELAYRCDPGLPIPVPGQFRRLLGAREELPRRVRLAGDYMSHATIEGAVRSGEAAAAEIESLAG